MKNRVWKTLLVGLLVAVVLVPAIASPFLAESNGGASSSTVSLPQSGEEGLPIGGDPVTVAVDPEAAGVMQSSDESEPETGSGSSAGDAANAPLAPASAEEEGVQAQGEETGPPSITPGSDANIIPLDTVGQSGLFNMSWQLAGGPSTPSGNVSSPVTGTLSINASLPSNISDPVYKGIQIRIYFGENHKYVDMEGAAASLFVVNYYRLRGTVEVDAQTGEEYLCFTLGDYDSVITGELALAFRFLGGITPDGTTVTPTAKLYYSAGEAEYQPVPRMETATGVSATAVLSQEGGSVEWKMVNGSNLPACDFYDDTEEVALEQELTFSSKVDVAYKPNAASATGVLNAQSFEVSTKLVLPADIDLPMTGAEISAEAGLSWKINGLNALTDTSGVIDYKGFTKTTDGGNTVYTFTATYTPVVEAGANPGAFNVDLTVNKLLVQPSATATYTVKAETTAQITAVDGVTTAQATGTGGASLAITRKPSIPVEFRKDSDLQESLVIGKNVTDEDNQTGATGEYSDVTSQLAYNSGDTAIFTITGLEVVNQQNPSKIYELRQFTIRDFDFNASYMRPTEVVLGSYEDAAGVAISPTAIVFEIGNTKKTYTLTDADKAAGRVAITDAMIQGLFGGKNNTSKLTGISIYFGNPMDSNFSVTADPKFKFAINPDDAPADARTLSNSATFSFINNPTWGTSDESDTYNYTYLTTHDTAIVQMMGNTVTTVSVSKNVKNVTSRPGASNTDVRAGDTLQYTLTVTNNTAINRSVIDPQIYDEMIGGYLDSSTITLLSTKFVGDTTVRHDNYDASPNYTSLATNVSVNYNGSTVTADRITWKYTGRKLNQGQTIVLVYTVQVKTAEQMIAGGIAEEGPYTIINRAYVYNTIGGGSSSVTMESIKRRPLLEYSLSAIINRQDASLVGFDTGESVQVDYTATVTNRVNPYEGSANLTHVGMAALLPDGFDVLTGLDTFSVARMGGEPLPATTPVLVEGAIGTNFMRYSYRTNPNSYQTEIFTVSFVKTGTQWGVMVYFHNESGQAGMIRHDPEESLVFKFSAMTTTQISSFPGGAPRYTFETLLRMGVCDDVTGNLNSNTAEPLYRYTIAQQDTHNSGYYSNTNDNRWQSVFETCVMMKTAPKSLQVRSAVQGSINQPVLRTTLAASRTNVSGYTGTNYGVGDSITYTFQVQNYSVFKFTPTDNYIVVAIAKGEVLDTSNIAVSSNGGQNGGAVTVTPLTPDGSYNYYKISWAGAISAFATNNGNTVGWLRVVFKTTVTADAESHFVDENTAKIDVNTRAFLMFTPDEAAGIRVYVNSNASNPLDLVNNGTTSYGDVGNIDQNDATTFRLGAEYKHSFNRARIRPVVSKTVSQAEGLKDKMPLVNTIVVTNANQANTAMQGGYVIEILPKPLAYRGMATGSSTGIGEPVAKIETNYTFEGAAEAQPVTILVWEIPKVNVGASITIKYDVMVSIANPHKLDEYGVKYSSTFYLPTLADQEIFKTVGAGGLMVDPVSSRAGLSGAASQLISYFAGYTQQSFLAAKAAAADMTLNVLGDDAPLLWQEVSKNTVGPADSYTYTLYAQNGSMQEDYCQYQNMVFVDRLPYIGDVGVVDYVQRGTSFVPTMQSISIQQEVEGLSAAPFTVPTSKYRVWYLLTPVGGQPSTEVFAQSHSVWASHWDGSSPAAAFDGWVPADEVDASDMSRVTAFRVELQADYQLSSRGRMMVKVDMKVPDSVKVTPDGSVEFVAYNSFAFFAKKTTLDQPTPAAMPVLQPARKGVTLSAPANNRVEVDKVVLDINGRDITETQNYSSQFEVTLTETNTNTTRTGYLVREGRTGAFKLVFENLPVGDYVITEVRDGNGAIITDLYLVTTESGSTKVSTNTLTFTIEHATATGQTVYVTFTNQQKPTSITINATMYGRPWSGGRFYIQGVDVDAWATTDATGKAVFNNLPWGSYWIMQETPDGAAPSGFKVSNDQSKARPGYMMYEKLVTLPIRLSDGSYVLDSTLNVANTNSRGRVSVGVTWNGSLYPEIDEERYLPRFYLVPSNTTDWNNGMEMQYTPTDGVNKATFTLDNVSSGRYWIYEVIYAKYEPLENWETVDWHYYEPGNDVLLNRYRLNEVIIIQQDQVYEVNMNNYYTNGPLPELDDVAPGSTGGYTGGAPSAAPPAPSSSGVLASSRTAEPGAITNVPHNSDDSSQPAAQITPSAPNGGITIPNEEPPLFGFVPITDGWGVFNLGIAAVGLLSSVVALISLIGSISQSTLGIRTGIGGKVLQVCTVVFGALSAAVFIGTANFSGAVGVVDGSTRLLVPVFLVQLLLLVCSLLVNRKQPDYDDDDDYAADYL